MALVAQYQTYYAIELNHWWEDWGGATYNKILVKEMPDEEVSIVTSTTASSGTITFLYPLLISSKYYLDGICDGHFKVCNQSYYSGGSTATNFTGYVISVIKIDEAGNETLVASVSTDFTYSVATDYLAVPFYLNITNAEITENEKILFEILVKESSSGTYLQICHDIDTTYGNDIKFRLPYAPKGGG